MYAKISADYFACNREMFMKGMVFDPSKYRANLGVDVEVELVEMVL